MRLKPDSSAARTNLAANLSRLGKPDLAEAEFKKAIELEPGNFDANHNLGELYARSGKVAKQRPCLSRPTGSMPPPTTTATIWSLAYVLTGRLTDARQLVQDLLRKKTPRSCITCWPRSRRKTGNLWQRPKI